MSIDDDTRRIRIEFSNGMKELSGKSGPDMDRYRDLLQSGMKSGIVSFTLDGAGGGTLDLGPDGKIKIKDSDEAALYQGLQEEVNRNKKP